MSTASNSIEPIATSQVSRALLTEMTTWGVDDWLFIINVELLLIMGMLLRIYAWAIVAVFLHFALMVVTRVVPNILDVYYKHLRQANKYSPHYSPIQKRGLRPFKFGRGDGV